MYSVFAWDRAVGVLDTRQWLLVYLIQSLQEQEKQGISVTGKNGNNHSTIGASTIVEYFSHLPGQITYNMALSLEFICF